MKQTTGEKGISREESGVCENSLAAGREGLRKVKKGSGLRHPWSNVRNDIKHMLQ